MLKRLLANIVLLQIVSDLHLETHPSYRDFDLPATARYLALLGDIGHVCDEAFFKWLESLLGRYETVLFLFGNHEPYHMRLSSAKSRMRCFAVKMERLRLTSSIGQFVFLDQTRYDFPTAPNVGVTILGCTLFSRVVPEQAREVVHRFVDFKDMIDWDVEDHNDCHQADVQWLNKVVEKISEEDPERKIIIFTHYSPSIDHRTKNPRYPKSSVDSGFMTDLSGQVCWKRSTVKLWASGHTHFNFDFKDEETGKRVVANQKGYYPTLPSSKKGADGNGFDVGKTFDLGAL
ncbi:MAG: hypothetical protein ALECFALPRED_009533 [Alectoria fallacina]|uniref:Calcineurin-like phosphoesterase domain-containing protein n=1 Tax=Alectoria fallacina TaxID=1903189 RepID=A0A8H3PIG4_9LECA|nr:MAG: hypothetical protein ALECFALPRED_009533 [Alectoria fallacina]